MTVQNKALHCIVIARNCPGISDLYNCRDFGFDSVQIIQEDDGYRLVAQKFENELYNGTFVSISAAREAFKVIYNHLTRGDSLKLIPQWTDFFDADYHTDELIISIRNHSGIIITN